ncbi:MAG: hypothetical protein K5705_08340 [Oscillospiraceae bacterium]|nr:hypothetical protein [Oscillospiraceae bacterium]
MDDPRNLEAQLLGDMTYDDPRKHAPVPSSDPRLAGASVPVLDDMGGGMPAPAPQTVQPQYQELTEEQVGILQQQRAAAGLPPYTEEEIADLKAEFINRQRIQAQEAAMAAQAAAQQAAAAALLSEPEDYNAPEKRTVHEVLPQVDASALLEEPAPQPEHRVAFNQEDLEAAKKAAAKRASDSLKEIPQQSAEDQQRARKELAALRQQQLDDLAEKGFVVAIVMTIIGFLAGVATVVFSMGAHSDFAGEGGVFGFFDKCYMFLGIALAILSLSIVARLKKVKGLTSFAFIITSILLIIPGIVELISAKKGAEGGLTSVIAYILAVIGCLTVTFVMSTSDKLNAYYSKSDIMYD